MKDGNINILVTGSSGFIGSQFVKKLEGKSASVLAMSRSVIPSVSKNVYAVQCEFNSYQQLRSLMRNIDVVVHLAWQHPQKQVAGKSLKSENIEAIKVLLQAMENVKARRLVFVSTLGAHEKALDPFSQEKYHAEVEIINSDVPEKIILRPDVIWSESRHDHFLKPLQEIMKYPIYPLIDPKTLKYPLNISDFLEILVDSVNKKMTSSFAMERCIGEEALTNREIQKLIAYKMEKRVRLPLGGFLGRFLFDLILKYRVSKGFDSILRLSSGPVGPIKEFDNDFENMSRKSQKLLLSDYLGPVQNHV